jgi:hypothetical protein
MKISNKKIQEKCQQEDPQKVADELNEIIVHEFYEDKYYTEQQYRKECEKVVLAYKKEYTEENWENDKSNQHLTWFYPSKKE